MANQTISSGIVNYDSDSISGLVNGDTILVRESELIINSDVRHAQQAAVFGALTIDAAFGGTITIDGRDVWWLPFTSGTGVVPSLDALDTLNVFGASASGEFLGVYNALATTPLTAGVVMPTSGFIKLRKKINTFVASETITLSTATVVATTSGQRGWLHLVGRASTSVTIPRLGNLNIVGDFFELGTTSGVSDQTFTFPVLDACPAIQIETSVGSNEYEWWICAGDRWNTATVFVPTDKRGKFFGYDITTGTIELARRSSNACGHLPDAGLKVRIPNLIFSSAASTNYALNTISTTAATRYDFVTTSAGKVEISNASMNWYLSCTSAFSIDLKDSSFLQTVLLSNIASTINIDSIAIGLHLNTQFTPLTITNCFTGGTITNSVFARYAGTSSGNVVLTCSDSSDFIIDDCTFLIFGSLTAITRGNASVYCALFTRATNIQLNNCKAIGSRITFSASLNIKVKNQQYADLLGGETTSTSGVYMVSFSSACNAVEVDNVSAFDDIPNVHPYLGVISFTNSYNGIFKNIGTPDAPYNMGTAAACGYFFVFSVSNGITIRRVYSINSRNTPISDANTVQNILIENFWCDGNDTQALRMVNCLARGCSWTNSVTGQAACYGRHWEDTFQNETTGRILIAANEPLEATQNQFTILSGSPRFTSTGLLSMPNAGDSVEWTCPYLILGHTAFSAVAPVITASNAGNIIFEYSIDGGIFKTLNATNLQTEILDAVNGFSLKVRATTIASLVTTITYIRLNTITDAESRKIQYAQPKDAIISITNILVGSRVQIYNLTKGQEIANFISGVSYTLEYYNDSIISSGDQIRIRAARTENAFSYMPFESIAIAQASGVAALVFQVPDEIYNTNAIDGSLVTELSGDYPNIQIDSNDVDGETTVQRIYAWFANNRSSEQGIRDYFSAIIAEDLVNYKIITSQANLKIDNIISTPLKVVGGRLYRDDGTTIIAPTSNSIQIDPSKVYGITVGDSGLTTDESQTLNKINLLTEDVSGLRLTAKALEQAPTGGGGVDYSADIAVIKKNTGLIPALL